MGWVQGRKEKQFKTGTLISKTMEQTFRQMNEQTFVVYSRGHGHLKQKKLPSN